MNATANATVLTSDSTGVILTDVQIIPVFFLLLGIIGLLMIFFRTGIMKLKADLWITIGVVFAGLGILGLVFTGPEYAQGLSLIATLAIVFAAFRTIKQVERKSVEEELDKISDWLMDITEYKNVGQIATFSELQQFFANAYETKMSLSLGAWTKQDECLKLSNIGNILATKFNDLEKPLPKAINNLVSALQNLAEINKKYSKEFANLPNTVAIMDVLASLGKYNTDCMSIHTENQGYIDNVMTEVSTLRYKKPIS